MLDSIQKFWIFTPIFLIIYILIIIFHINNPESYEENTVRYVYSAIFQGFAAILAISITAVLITLHQISNTIHSKEERIYKIIGKRVPNHIPRPIRQEKFYVQNVFLHDLMRTPEIKNLAERRRTAISLRNEVRANFRQIEIRKINSEMLVSSFKISLPLIMIVMILSLTSLVFTTPAENSVHIRYYDFVIDSQKMLYIVFSVTIYVIFSLFYFFYKTISVWNSR